MADRGPSDAAATLFHEAFLRSQDAIEITDRDGVIVDINPAFERIYGFARSECVGKKPRLVRSSKTPPETYARLWRDILDPQVGHWSGEMINIDRSGGEHRVVLSIYAMRDAANEITHFLGIATDVSRLRVLENKALHDERLVALGRLAAGVAHEINTPLANILLISESLQRHTKDEHVRERAQAIAGQVEHASRIVHGLLDFSRGRPTSPIDLDLASVAEEALTFLRGKQSPDVDVVREASRTPLIVHVDHSQILQVFVNLIQNGYDAMGGRGTLFLRSSASRGWAEVSISDTGPGLAPEIVPHLFEPFFTTKGDHGGTGLGLSICHGIVARHGGELTVQSRVGEGATFTVRLPLHPTPTPGPPPFHA
ncbi:MAG: two-component system sensor histidine kinase NtrB [Thermoplasmata archaeon]